MFSSPLVCFHICQNAYSCFAGCKSSRDQRIIITINFCLQTPSNFSTPKPFSYSPVAPSLGGPPMAAPKSPSTYPPPSQNTWAPPSVGAPIIAKPVGPVQGAYSFNI